MRRVHEEGAHFCAVPGKLWRDPPQSGMRFAQDREHSSRARSVRRSARTNFQGRDIHVGGAEREICGLTLRELKLPTRWRARTRSESIFRAGSLRFTRDRNERDAREFPAQGNQQGIFPEENISVLEPA